jgi:hypothetical protein
MDIVRRKMDNEQLVDYIVLENFCTNVCFGRWIDNFS